MSNQVLDYMESLEKSNKKLGEFVKVNEPLSEFLTDFDFLKESHGLTNKDISNKTGISHKTISRVTSFKTSPSYAQLLQLSEAIGGKLFITPMKDMTVQVPYDLQETVRKLAKDVNMTTNEYLSKILRNAIELENSQNKEDNQND